MTNNNHGIVHHLKGLRGDAISDARHTTMIDRYEKNLAESRASVSRWLEINSKTER